MRISRPGIRAATRSGERASSSGATARNAASAAPGSPRSRASRSRPPRRSAFAEIKARTSAGSWRVRPRWSSNAYSPVRKKRTSSRAEAYPPSTTTVPTRPRARGSAAASKAGPAPRLTATSVTGPGRKASAVRTGSTSVGRRRACVRPGMVGTITAKPARASNAAAARSRLSRLPSGANPCTRTRPGRARRRAPNATMSTPFTVSCCREGGSVRRESRGYRPPERNSARNAVVTIRRAEAATAGPARTAATASRARPATGRPWRLLAISALDQAPPVKHVDLHHDLRHETHSLQKRLESQVRLPPEPRAQGRHPVLRPAHQRILAAEVVEDDDGAAGLHHALHLAENGDGIGD